ncbi:MAG: hypothetical protein KAJ37_08870, partial [Candidatus Krumholzibacteria bacterium]|nr:hypothetical protein [Candidatus Krumholzibacteria bacterium]
DSIIARSADPQIKRRALLWKINAIPVAQNAIFRIDPLIALLDIWTFDVQMSDYFETGAGREAFGEWQPIAVDACRRIETQIAAIGNDLAGEVTSNRGREFVVEWTKTHKIQDLLFTRQSTRGYWYDIVRGQGQGVVGAMETMTDAVRVLSDRMESSYRIALKQARWQAELAIQDELMQSVEVQTVLDGIDRLAEMDEDVADVAEDIATIKTEFGILQRDFAAIVDSINAYWLTATTTIEKERAGMETLIDQQREAVFTDLEAMAGRLVDRSAAKARGAVAGMIVPGIIGLIVLMAVPLAVGFFVGRSSGRRSRPPHADST